MLSLTKLIAEPNQYVELSIAQKEGENVIVSLADRVFGRYTAEEVIDPVTEKVVYLRILSLFVQSDKN